MLRVVFMGTPEFSVPTLAEIIGAGHEVVAVYAQPPRPAGRGMEPRKSPVHVFAKGAGIPVLTPRSLKQTPEQQVFAAHGADVAIVIAYGLILPQAVLDAPRLGCLNMHASALPRWRGAAPIQRAIMAGDAATAAMVMRMEAGLDTGPVCLAEQVPIGADETAGQLHDRLMQSGAGLMVRALAALERGSLVATPQPAEGVTYAAKIDKAESRIVFDRPARVVHDHVRGLSPVPGAWFEAMADGKVERIKVLRTAVMADAPGTLAVQLHEPDVSPAPGTVLDSTATIACRQGAIRLVEVQRAGKRPMSAAEFLRGFPLTAGTMLGS